LKVAIIGATGQLGSDLVLYKPENVSIYPLSRKDIDITNKDLVAKVLKEIKPDIVINTAAFHKTDECEDKVGESFKINTVAIKYLCEVCKEINAKLVHISTDFVFDGKKILEREPYYEDDIPNPINIYGLSKFSGEKILENYLDNYLIVRVSSLFGRKKSKEKGSNFVYKILELAEKFNELKVINDIYMTPTYTKDAAKEIWNLIINEAKTGIYHVSNSGICTWYEFAKEILRINNKNIKIIPVKHTEFPTKAKRPLWSPLASKKGIKLRHWKEALLDFFNKY